jgi:hypothetical protein
MLKTLALAGTTACLFMGAGWFYKETIFQFMYNIEAIKQNTLDEVVLTVGDPKGECSALVHLSTWDKMNQLQIYRWVVACEDAKKVK